MKIHLACWRRHIPGFIHVDQCDLPHINHKTSIDQLPMFDNCSADLIYCSHALEYFDHDQAKVALQEWHRVLKPNSTLRLAVPDFEALIQVYKQTGNIHKILGPLYGKMTIDTEEDPEKTIYHKTVYDFDSLKELLTENGFKNVRRYNWQNTIHKDYDDHSQAYFPHMDKENGLLVSLNVEAEKI